MIALSSFRYCLTTMILNLLSIKIKIKNILDFDFVYLIDFICVSDIFQKINFNMGNTVKKILVQFYLVFLFAFAVTQAHAAHAPAGFEESGKNDKKVLKDRVNEMVNLCNQNRFMEAANIYNSYNFPKTKKLMQLGVFINENALKELNQKKAQKKDQKKTQKNAD